MTDDARRRSLRFSNLDEVVADARRLAQTPRESLGRWTLAQTCRHLADSIHGSIDGLDLRRHRFKRWFFARKMRTWTFENGIPRGVTVDPRLTPPPDVELPAALAQLERAVERYKSFRGRLKPHPLFGRMDRPTWDRLHCFHCAHHLSLIVPVSSS